MHLFVNDFHYTYAYIRSDKDQSHLQNNRVIVQRCEREAEHVQLQVQHNNISLGTTKKFPKL